MKNSDPHDNAVARGPGRPSNDRSVQRRERLLDEAEKRFGDVGYAATSVREVAQAAGVNPALVHYYFKHKRGLLTAVLDRVFEPAAEALADLRQPSARHPAPIGLDYVVDILFGVMSQHPNLPRLVVREVMLSDGELRELFLKRYASRLGGALPPVLRAQQQAGSIDPKLDASLLTLMLLGLVMFPVIAQPLAQQVLGIDYSKPGLEMMRQHIDSLLREGVHR